jgi:hypothetical protein
MKNTPHTPAPWKIATFDGPHEYASIEAGDGISELIRVCDIPNWPCAIEEMQANARLIAAAPDLLDLLEAAVTRVQIANEEGNPILSAWLPDALSTLRKAKGEA